MYKYVTIKTFKTRIDAEVDRSFLKSKNIESIIEGNDGGGAFTYPFNLNANGVELKVLLKDKEKAIKILQQESA